MTFWAALPPMDAATASPLPYVWVGQGPPPSSAAQKLADWAKARGFIVGASVASSPSPSAPASTDFGASIEAALDRAREAATFGDREKTLSDLDDALNALERTPRLPHAAWLRAELLRARAQLVERTDRAQAAELTREAEAIAGPRWSPSTPPPATTTPKATEGVTVTLPALSDPRIELRIDGHSVDAAAAQLQLAPARHHIALYVKGELAWATFATLGRDARLPFPEAPLLAPCSSDDFDGTTIDDQGPKPSPQVQCDRWILASESAGALVVALCAGAKCDAFGPATRPERLPPAPRPGESPRQFPAWAKWTLVGAGVVGVGLAAAALGGVFSPRPSEDRFVGRGVRVE